ncbi:hypothetical protein CC85DRAFT_262974 [Cutaneotrichosporon oleaginosum]|uniref:SEC7 domain-containing protein n=1 Tax=Cutaneotrichosporon oleaginosum TaxID=879819 RepID=A0A0J0XIH8_9TREE|nr:uncharacterized protein CC85DRAFT_262974 [Cutaneotrichosporon oleaginosum]KLT40852.1 hypothetical protein CC85DRAFT_262974 [Cutaneotrichosporon oleaginosum]TXT09288.1 hypothetical protein COLE_03222 [Cutaneotrichosporon oleaginosum]
MSESPTRYQPTPTPSAEIRSLAIAKLKRAASLPRTPDGRRQPHSRAAAGPSGAASEDSHGAPSSLESGMTPSPTKGAGHYGGDEELLAASPSANAIRSGGGSSMQRSNSDSSSFHMPTPYGSANASPFFTAQASPASNPGTDWAAYQLAQSYLPSISPVPPTNATAPPSSFPTNLTPGGGGGAGRNTPSPLPSLGELRNLSRSNSAAARQNAMNKLIGGAATPTKTRNPGGMLSSSEEDVTLSLPGSARALHRSGTIGVPRMFGMPAETVVDDSTITPIPDTAYDVPRPRLQRSFTVSSSNMGEERRSAVGRRMVERLGARRAARQQEEQEVRQLWEERRRTRGSQKGIDISTPDGTPPRPAVAPSVAPVKPPPTAFAAAVGGGGLAALLASAGSDRTPSRSTQHSDNVFEYEAHLKRSMSTRTARTEAMEESPAFESRPAFDDMGEIGGDHGIDDPTPLPIPELPFATPKKHTAHESISSSATTVMGKAVSPATTSLERVPSAPSMDPFNSYHSSQQSGSMYDDEREERLDGDDWDAHTHDFTRQTSRPDTHSIVDTNTGHHGHGDTDSAYYSDGVRPMSKVSEPGSSNSGHLDPPERRPHKKSSSISKLMGRAMLNAVKPRISVASNETPPLSPREGASGSRRQSDASNSQSHHSVHSQYSHRGVSPTPDPKYNKLVSPHSLGPKSPMYKKDEAPDHANNLLIQHQLTSGAPSPVSFLPRATPNDPRIHNSKLSPFPGIVALESRSRRPSEDQPRLIQQTSDPTLPTVRGMSPHAEVGRGSTESGGKHKGVDASNAASISSQGGGSGFGTHSSQSHSNGHGYGSHSRGLSHSQSDDHRHGHHELVSNTNGQARNSPVVQQDILRPGAKQRPEIPSFMMNRRRAPPPPIELADSNVVSINDDPVTPPSSKLNNLPPRSREVLRRMDGVLSLPANDPSRPDFLDDPPRKLLLSQQVLQVVNVNTVKDRYLFLFNDLLVIAKPVMGSGATLANLDMKFVVKSIVGLDKVTVTGLSDEPSTQPSQHPTVQQFIRDFAADAKSAVRDLVQRSNPSLDAATLASLLFKTDNLDKTQLGLLLASDPDLLIAYIGMFDFNLVRIDEALRLFLLDVRLPTDIHAAEAILRGFADGYIAANENSVTFDAALAEDLVLATLELNDMLYSTFGFAFPNHAVSRDTFVHAFESKDPHGLVPAELLADIYDSIRGGKLVQALSSHEGHLVRELVQTPARLPSKLTCREWSQSFQISIPKPDPHFQVKLVGTGLELDPPVLDFSRSKDASFKVRGTRLGPQTLLLERLGASAALYPTLGKSWTFNIERAFMRNTFHVAFPSHLGGKRKYCFSVPDATLRAKWGTTLNRQIWLACTKKQQQTSGAAAKVTEGRAHRAAEAVALQVLRDALMPHENCGEDADASPHSNTPSSIPARVLRQGSISAAYSKLAPDEADLPLQPTRGHHAGLSGLGDLQTGKEIVLLCRQNSLLPSVLELLQKGTGTANGKAKAKAEAHANAQPQPQPHPQPQAHHAKAADQKTPLIQNPPRAPHLQAAVQPKRSAGLRALMHDRRL